MAFVKVNNINLYYQLKGKGEPIVFISGFSTHRATWHNYAERLSPLYQTLIFDNRGTGESDAPPPPYTIEMMVEDTSMLMDQLGLKHVYMIGSSMGTAIIQTFALRYPEKIKKGILISPFAKLPYTSIMQTETIGKLLEANLPFQLIIESVMPWLYSSTFLNDKQRAQVKMEEMVSNAFPIKPEGYLGQLTALQSFDLEDQVKNIQTNMLLIAGREDLSTPLYCAQYLHQHLPSSNLKILESVGHMPHVEEREKVFEIIQNFLKEKCL